MVPEEEPFSVTSPSMSMGLQKARAKDLTDQVREEGFCAFSLPQWCNMAGNVYADCDENAILTALVSGKHSQKLHSILNGNFHL